jgi:GntR family transcriptional regulator
LGAQKSNIDKNGVLPLYYQLETVLRERISDHLWNPGAKIPSELDLCKEFGLSRNTVRQALLNLVDKGVLYREQGHGTFVTQLPFEYPTDRLMSFTEEMTRIGMTSGARILIAETTAVSSQMADDLGLQGGAEMHRLKRLRLADDKPVALEDAYLPVSLFPGILDGFSASDSLYERMNKMYGLVPASATERIEACSPSAEEARLLQITKATPVLRIQRRTFLKNGTPMESVGSVYRGDAYRLVFNLRRP